MKEVFKDRYLEWRYFGDDQLPLGYAYVAKMMKKGLQEVGVNLDREAHTVIIHSLPWKDFSWYKGQRAGLFTMWEHSEVPPGFKAGMAHFDFIVTPSAYSAKLFAGFYDKPIYVVPHGIDPQAFYPSSGLKRKKRPKKFVVLSSATNSRKGIVEVVNAFQQANLPNSKLILKGSPDRVAQEVPNLPDNVIVMGTKLPEEDLRKLYQSASCYLSGSRGEGWDLIAFEALACGIPTIVPDHTGYKDWNKLAQGRVSNWTGYESPIKERYGPSGNWNVMDSNQMAEKLMNVYSTWDKKRDHALESAKFIRENMTWAHSAQTLVEQLGDLKPLRGAGLKEDHQMLVECECIQNHDAFFIGPVSGGPLRKGAYYKFPNEVARVLSEAGFVRQVS